MQNVKYARASLSDQAIALLEKGLSARPEMDNAGVKAAVRPFDEMRGSIHRRMGRKAAERAREG